VPVVEEAAVEEQPLDTELSEAAPSEAALDETAPLAFDPFEVFVGDQAVLCLPDKTMECPEGALCTYSSKEKNCQINAEKKVASLAPVEVVVPDEEEVEALGEIIGDPAVTDPTAIDAVSQTGNTEGEAAELPSESEPSPEATVTETVLTEEDTRSSTQEFDDAPSEVEPGKKDGLSNLEIAGLAILGTLAIGAILDKDKEVVENTGDRVVVEDGNGNYSVYKDDDALLREPGTTVRTETFSDGSTRTVMVRENGSQVVTIRDATGRVLQRTSYNAQGLQTQLIDDLSPERPVDLDRLPTPNRNTAINDSTTLPDIREELALIERADYAHSFSLRQIREIRKVRDLAPTIDVNNVTFDSGSSAIKKSEAKKLQRLGRLMAALIKENPGEMFLIEGHTDAVGRGGYNLALSDRRAESVARALTEFYGVPAENLVVQGYGEKELKSDTQSDERLNRRAAVRIITPLLKISMN
jgi:outer membrane protein OmpA-like peptidoglycan-associated protein